MDLAHNLRKARARLLRHDFPGNVRELRNILQRAAALCHDNTIRPADLGLADDASLAQAFATQDTNGHERNSLQDLINQYAGNRRAMAAALGVSERTLYRRLRRHRNSDPRGT